MKPLDTNQRIFVIEVASAVGAAAFVLGIWARAVAALAALPSPPELTVAHLVQALPPSVRRDIAIDYCASGKAAHRMCAMLPMVSPIEPMDGR